MIVELLRPAGPDLARRWLAALLLVDISDREAVVASIERQVADVYGVKSTTVSVPLTAQKRSEFLKYGASGSSRGTDPRSSPARAGGRGSA